MLKLLLHVCNYNLYLQQRFQVLFETQLKSAGPCVAVCLSGFQTPPRRVAVFRLTFDTLLPSSTPPGLRATADGEWDSLSSLPIRRATGCCVRQ